MSRHLADGEGGEELGAEGVGVEGEAVVDEGGAEPEVVADQRLLAQVRPQEQLHEPVLPRPPACALELETKVDKQPAHPMTFASVSQFHVYLPWGK